MLRSPFKVVGAPASNQQIHVPSHDKKIWAIGGGKGGVGKSFIISNLAISLARSGKRVVLIDLDLGSANLHTCLGCDIPKQTLSDFFSGRTPSLNSLLTQTQLSNVSFISGANDSVVAANIPIEDHNNLIKNLLALPCDHLLIDLGAGTHSTTLDYFLLANRPIIGVTPEPTSIENAYRFIKSAFYRQIKNIEAKLNLKSIVDQAMDHKNNLGIKTPSDLVYKIASLNPSMGAAFLAEIQKFQLYLIMNQVRTRNDVDTGHSVRSICNKYFGINTHYVGYLEYDNAVWQAIRKRKPLILEYPYSTLVVEFANIARKLDGDERSPQSNLLRTS